MSLLFLLGRYLVAFFCFSPIAVALLHRFSELPKSGSLGLSVAYLRADSCPLSIPVSRFTQRVITLYI